MTSIFLVMRYNYPYMIFDDLDKAIDHCTRYKEKHGKDDTNLRIDEYEMNGAEKHSSYVWSSWWHGKQKDKE